MTDIVEGTEAVTEPTTVEIVEQDSAPESTPELTPEERLEKAEQAKAALEKRIARQTAANREQQRRAEQLEREVNEYRAKYAPKDTSAEPNPDDYKTTEEYLEAKGFWKAEQKYKADAKAQREAAEKAEWEKQTAEVTAKFRAKEAAFRESHPDYDDVVSIVNEAIEAAPMNMGKVAFSQFCTESEDPAALFYALGKNPEVIDKIQSLSPVGIIKEMVKLEMGLSKAAPKADVKPKPLTPISGNGRVSKELHQKSAREIADWVNS